MLHGRDGVRWVMSCALFPPDGELCIQAEEFNFHLVKPQNLFFFSFSRSLSCAFLQTPGVLSCAFFSGVASLLPPCHKAWICEVLQRLLSFWQVLPSQPRNSVVLSEWSLGFFVTSLTKVLLAQLLSLVRQPARGRVWVVPYSFHFLMMELTVLLGTFNTRNSFIPVPRSIPPHSSISEFYGLFHGLPGRVSALTCTVNCGTLYRKAFLSKSCPTN